MAQRWILACLRHVPCFSLAELNQHIARLWAGINDRAMRVNGRSRRQLFDELERPQLRPLPEHDFALY